MLKQETDRDTFTEFVEGVEPRIRHALIPFCGLEAAKDATAEALMYGWENWKRVAALDNPAGYLYRVARNKAAKGFRRRRVGLPAVPNPEMPWVEPGLPKALARLSPKQRTVVWLVHGLGWQQVEVAELLGISAPSVQTHERRGMAKLRTALGGVS